MINYCPKALRVSVLLLALTTAAPADGIGHADKTPPPPPPAPSARMTDATGNVLQPGETESTAGAADVMTDIALRLLMGMMSLI